jgi:hypothetical protein
MRKIVIVYEHSIESILEFSVEITWYDVESFGIVEVQLVSFQTLN